jgi:hypothetical protein
MIVVGITARDVEHAQAGTFAAPGWLSDPVIAILMGSGVAFRPQNVEAIRRGPIDFLLSWIQNPDVDGHRALANYLPLLFAQTAVSHFALDPAADMAQEAALRLTDPHHVTLVGDAPNSAWWWTAGPVGLLVRSAGEIPGLARMDTALVIDDRAEQLASQDQAADGWREWLRIANALNLREQPTTITAVTEVSGHGVPEPVKHATVRDDAAVLPAEWRAAHEDGTIAERVLIEEFVRLAAGEPIPAPVVGHEVDGLPVDLAWPDKKIAVFLDLALLDPGDRLALESDEWRIFPDDPAAVLAALREAA